MRDPKKNGSGDTLRLLVLVTQIGLCIVTAIAISGLLGYGVDRLLGSSPVGILIGLFLGIFAGFSSAWSLIARYVKTPEEKPLPPVDTERELAEREFRKWKEEREKRGGDDV